MTQHVGLRLGTLQNTLRPLRLWVFLSESTVATLNANCVLDSPVGTVPGDHDRELFRPSAGWARARPHRFPRQTALQSVPDTVPVL